MPRWALFLCILAFGLAAALARAPALAQKRVALVIGNDKYQHVPVLQKAGNDAKKIGDTLKGLGFTVISGSNQTRREMSETLSSFDRAVSPGDIAFFFFAGHGFEI